MFSYSNQSTSGLGEQAIFTTIYQNFKSAAPDNCDPFDQRLISYRLRDISPSVAERLFDLNAEQLSSFFYLANSYTAFENITQEIAEQVAFEEVAGCECFFPRNRIGIVWSETGYPIVEVER